MKIISRLNKPYTNKERCDFIVKNNHNLGYEIQETDDALLAVYNEPLPPTEEEIKQHRISKLKQLLANTDYVVIKIAEGSATKEDYADVIANRQAWREEIRELKNESTPID